MARPVWPIPPRPSVLAAMRGQHGKPEVRPFQRQGIDWLRKWQYNGLLADAPGLGKTIQALVALAESEGRLLPALVVCPSSVAWNWRREARRWAPGMDVTVVEGLHSSLGAADITVCPWDLLASHEAALTERGFRTIVCDEVHYARNRMSQRGAATARLCAGIPHRILLSGTPLINVVEELETVQDLIGPNPPMLRRLLEDAAPDIPPKKRIILDVTIPADAMREYRRAEQEFGAYLEESLRAAGVVDVGAAVTSAMGAAALTQVGYLRRILGRAKALPAAAWIVRQLRAGEPVVVFADHADVLDALAHVLDGAKIPYGRLDGSTSRRDRQRAIDGFQSGQLSVFLGSQAAREGITLHRARHALFVERWWTPAAEEQAEDRIRRIGQEHETFIWFMLVPDTYDDRISEIIEHKRKLITKTIGAHAIERQDATGLLGEWLRGQPAAEADLEMPDFPELPVGTKVHAFLFSRRNWDRDTVTRWLSLHGYKAAAITLTEKVVRAELRRAAGFHPETFERLRLGPDMGAILGKPKRIRQVVSYRTRRPKRRKL